eukprot:scaffold89732_cov59-Phaeocystis_antarctica.AAC.2
MREKKKRRREEEKKRRREEEKKRRREEEKKRRRATCSIISVLTQWGATLVIQLRRRGEEKKRRREEETLRGAPSRARFSTESGRLNARRSHAMHSAFTHLPAATTGASNHRLQSSSSGPSW